MIRAGFDKRTTSSQKNRRHGFTLLEVLLTSLLMSMILASLWALSHVYTRSFETGSFKIEESQIVRSLRQQFTDDIRGAIPIAKDEKSQPTSLVTKEVLARSLALYAQLDRNPPLQGGSDSKSNSGNRSSSPNNFSSQNSNSHTQSGSGSNPTLTGQVKLPNDFNNGLGSSSSAFGERLSLKERILPAVSLPTFQLVGSQDSLQLQILQLVPRQNESSRMRVDENGTRTSVIPAPELRTIEYTFEPPPVLELRNDENEPGYETDMDEKEEPPPSGLMRKERAWVLPSLLTRYKATRRREDDQFDSQSSNQLDFSDSMLMNEIVQSGVHDNEVTWVPEVIAMEFRYYDGQVWQSSWDSKASKKLPVAIEIAFQIQSVVEQKRQSEEEVTLEDLDRTMEMSLFDESHLELEAQKRMSGSRRFVPTYRHLIKLPLGEQKPRKRNLSDAPLDPDSSVSGF